MTRDLPEMFEMPSIREDLVKTLLDNENEEAERVKDEIDADTEVFYCPYAVNVDLEEDTMTDIRDEESSRCDYWENTGERPSVINCYICTRIHE